MTDWKVAKREGMAVEEEDLWMGGYFLPFEWTFLLQNPF